MLVFQDEVTGTPFGNLLQLFDWLVNVVGLSFLGSLVLPTNTSIETGTIWTLTVRPGEKNCYKGLGPRLCPWGKVWSQGPGVL